MKNLFSNYLLKLEHLGQQEINPPKKKREILCNKNNENVTYLLRLIIQKYFLKLIQ